MLKVLQRDLFHRPLNRVVIWNIIKIEYFLECLVGSQQAFDISIGHTEVDFKETDSDHWF